MAKYNYPNITVSGRGNLKVYSIDFNTATTDNPGRASVTYVSEDNSLTPPSLSLRNPSFISIGGINFKGYAVKYKKSLSSSGENLLTVDYVDGSFILDKYYVGLFGRHANGPIPMQEMFGGSRIQERGLILQGLKTFNVFNGQNNSATNTNIPNWMILVGKSVDPCRAQFESIKTDPCDPCPSPENSLAKQASSIDCDKLRSQELMLVDYSFDELLSALQIKNIKFNINATYNKQYRASFFGSLREVLKSWCSLFGLSFYYDNDRVNIYDLSNGVRINASFPESSILSKVEESSIEHSRATSTILYYGQRGVDKNYSCSDKHGKKVVCRPLTIKDLGVKDLRDDYGCTSESELYNLIEFMSVFSSYEPTLREMIAWFEVYGIRDAQDAKNLIKNKRTSSVFGNTKYGGYYSMGVDDDLNKNSYSLPILSMTLKQVYDNKSPEFKNLMGGSILDDSVKARAASQYEPYFFIASQNEARYASMANWENNIGQGFLGRYFIRWYENYSSHSTPSILACQGDQAQFFKQGSSSLDFTSFMPGMDFSESPEFEARSTKYKKPKNYSSLPVYKFNSAQGTVRDSFILVTRSAIWSPPLADNSVIKKIMELAGPHRPIKLGPASSFGDFVNDHPGSKNKKFSDRDELWMGFKMASGFNISTSSANHPTEQAFGKNCEANVAEFSSAVDLGLRSKRCTRINIGPIGTIFMPPQARVNERDDGGYSVFVSHDRGADFLQSVPKLEMVVSSFKDEDVLVNEVNYNANVNLSDIDSTFFDRQKNNCLPNYTDISNRMNKLVDNTTSVNNLPSKTITYEIAGLPVNNFSPQDGLVDFSVRVGSRGVSTTLTFSDMRNRSISKSETLKEFEDINNDVVSNSFRTQNIHKNLLSTNLSNNTIEL